MGLKVQLLGEFRVWRDGKLISHSEWKSRRLQALFQFLVAEPGRVYTVDALIEELCRMSEILPGQGAFTCPRQRTEKDPGAQTDPRPSP
jgi:hypothetical protein